MATTLCAIAGLVVLLLRADNPRAYVGAAIFGASLLLLFSTSSVYHIPRWTGRTQRLLRRLDHAVIFLAVAGLYTPFCLQVLGPVAGLVLLCCVWVAAAAGIAIAQGWTRAPAWVDAVLYCGLGWVALFVLPQLAGALPLYALLLLLLAGLLYSAGALSYATGRPALLPRVFGHHELFHSLVAGASGLVFAVVFVTVLPR